MNTIKFLQSFEAEHAQVTPLTKFSQLRAELFSKGICWTDSARGNFAAHDCFQVVLFLKKNATGIDFDNPIVTECNGLVLEYVNHSWSVLAVPTANCTKTKISMNQANRFFQAKKYKVYEVLDATIINLYNHCGSWKISTSKGYDVTHFQFTPGYTYMQMFERIASTKYPKFAMSQLDPTYSYTVAIRASEFHSFNETKHIPLAKPNANDYLKLIKATNLQTFVDMDLDQSNILIPIYYPVEVKNANSVSVLMNYAKHAYVKYAKGFESNNFKFKPLYGYVLRSESSSVPRAYKNIMITSTLFATIKYGLYTKSSESITHLVVNMFINQRRKEQFKVLFDQYQSLFNQLEAIALVISQEVTTLITTKQCESDHPIIQQLAHKVAHQFWTATDEQQAQLPKESIQSMVYDFIHSNDYAADFQMLLEA